MEKIAECLFDNKDKIPDGLYLQLMNLTMENYTPKNNSTNRRTTPSIPPTPRRTTPPTPRTSTTQPRRRTITQNEELVTFYDFNGLGTTISSNIRININSSIINSSIINTNYRF